MNEALTTKTALQRISKAKLIRACIVRQQDLTDYFLRRLRALTQGEREANDQEFDIDSLAHKVQLDAELYGIINQHRIAQEAMHILETLEADIHSKTFKTVEPGAVIVTDLKPTGIFFASVAIGTVEFAGEKVVTLSTTSPTLNAMKGKQRGDTFVVDGIAGKIEDIY